YLHLYFFTVHATPWTYTLSLHDALPILLFYRHCVEHGKLVHAIYEQVDRRNVREVCPWFHGYCVQQVWPAGIGAIISYGYPAYIAGVIIYTTCCLAVAVAFIAWFCVDNGACRIGRIVCGLTNGAQPVV